MPDITLGTIDTEEPAAGGVSDVSAGQALRIDLGTVDTPDPTFSGFGGVTVQFPNPDPFQPAAYATLHDRTGALVDALPFVFGVQWLDALSDTGSGSLSYPMSEPEANQIQRTNLVRCWLDGKIVFTWEIEDVVPDLIAQGEEQAQVIRATGRGSAARLSTSLVYPEAQQVRGPVDTRLFSFASPGYPSASWQNAVRVGQANEVTFWGDAGLPAPLAWPAALGEARWIWGSTAQLPGRCYFRRAFSLAAAGDYLIAGTGDNYWTIYLDGVPIIGDTDDSLSWLTHRVVTLPLAAGAHTLAAVVENIGATPAGLLCAVYQTDTADQSVVTNRVLWTDAQWQAFERPTVTPGWTPGAILTALRGEAQARGELAGLAVSFTAVNDSAGQPWPTIPEFAVKIGVTFLDVVEQLAAEGWIEWRMSPLGDRLDVWRPGNAGSFASTRLVAGIPSPTGLADLAAVNVTSITHGQQAQVYTRALVRYPGGTFQLDDPGGQAVYGIRSVPITVSQPDEASARVAATAIFNAARRSVPETTVGFESTPGPSILADGFLRQDRPYTHWDVGDTLTAPDRLNTETIARCLSFSVTVDDMGDPVFAAELDRRLQTPDEQRVELLRSTGGAPVRPAAGSKPIASTVTPSKPVFSPAPIRPGGSAGAGGGGNALVATIDDISWSYGGIVQTLEVGPWWRVPYDAVIIDVTVMVTATGTLPVTVTLETLSGVAAATITATLPAGADQAVQVVNSSRVQGDRMRASITAAPAPASQTPVQDLSIVVRYRPANTT